MSVQIMLNYYFRVEISFKKKKKRKVSDNLKYYFGAIRSEFEFNF